MVKFTKKYPFEWNLPVEILILCIDFNTIRQMIKIYGMPTWLDCIAAPSPSSRKKPASAPAPSPKAPPAELTAPAAEGETFGG